MTISQLYSILEGDKCNRKEKKQMKAIGIWSVQVAILNRGGEGGLGSPLGRGHLSQDLKKERGNGIQAEGPP